jgi:16S rRNA (guanine527-N7)-methyltransferase
MGILDDIDTFSRFTRVSRETIISLKNYAAMLEEENLKLNLIGKSTVKQIWIRHFLDSAQVIDYIDKNDSILTDLGSGAGFPGAVLGILAKERNIPIKISLIEKSPKKAKFLRRLITDLKIKGEVIEKNIMDENFEIRNDVILARAFKPLEKILGLIHKKAKNFKKIFIYLGKTGQREINEASKSWDIEYKKRKSVTSSDSVILEINKLKKIN